MFTELQRTRTALSMLAEGVSMVWYRVSKSTRQGDCQRGCFISRTPTVSTEKYLSEIWYCPAYWYALHWSRNKIDFQENYHQWAKHKKRGNPPIIWDSKIVSLPTVSKSSLSQAQVDGQARHYLLNACCTKIVIVMWVTHHCYLGKRVCLHTLYCKKEGTK